MNSPDSVCLITPPSIFLLDERVFMNLGILRIAAVLEKRGINVKVLDLSGIENYEEALQDFAESSDEQFFGITATTPQMPAVRNIIRVLRNTSPNARLILGGPHVTLVNAAARGEEKRKVAGRGRKSLDQLRSMFDVLVAGDGEEAIFAALAPEAPDLIDADAPKSEMFLRNEDLENLPFPARHLVDVSTYHYHIDGVRALSLIAQLGCPFECGFCGGRQSPMLRRVRMRTSDSIVAEIREMHQTYGINGFMFYDDELNVNPKMVELMNGITDLQVELDEEFRLRGFVKAELFTEAQAVAMYRAGFRWLLVGFESGSPRILTNINKKASQDQNSRCLEIARRNGLKVKALMSIGHPGESPETIQQTLDWLLSTAPDDFDVSIITTYPGTPYYDLAKPDPDHPGIWTYTYERTGDRLHAQELDYTVVADYYKGDPEGGYRSFVHTDYLSAEELVEARNHIEKTARRSLEIPFNQSAAAVRYEHSMGQAGPVPSYILKSSESHPVRKK